MSQITRCPECHTRFKVVDDQLRISGGWVRCGKCKAVFDALAHLSSRPQADAAEPVQPAAAVAAEDRTPADASDEGASAVLVTANSIAIDPEAPVPELSVLVFPRRAGFGDSTYVDSTWKDSYLDPMPEPGLAEPQPESEADPQPHALESEWDGAQAAGARISPALFSAHEDMKELHEREERLLSAAAGRRDDADLVEPDPEAIEPHDSGLAAAQPALPPEAEAPQAPAHSRLSSWSAAEDKILDRPQPVAADAEAADGLLAGASAAPADEPRFVRDARRKAFWGRPGVVAVSLLAALVLVLALLAQWGIQQRDGIVARYPAVRAVLEPWCAWAGCQIAPVRQIERVQIDSTSFRKIAPQQFELSVVLRNQAAHVVAMPALELTLNDAADKLVIRKVLLPAELGAPAALPASGEWTANAVVQVVAGEAEVVGYRVLAFYP
ncbi:hypothetical protein GCM10027082_12120 [Comamonas humi]